MKKLITVLFTIVISIATYAEKITFVTGEWEPYSSEKMQNYGIYGELISAICKESGIEYEIKFYPWARAEKMVETGDAFAAFPYALTEERKSRFDFSDIMTYGNNVYLYHAKNTKISEEVKKFTKITDFKKYVFGCANGTFYEEYFEKIGMKLEKTNGLDLSIKKLQAKRIDFIVDEKMSLVYLIQKLFLEDAANFKFLDISYGEKMPNGLIVARKYPNSKDLLVKFNSGLKKIKQNGIYYKIEKKYGAIK